MKMGPFRQLTAIIGVFLTLCVTLSLSVIVITDLDLGQIPQPPKNTESDLVHVRVTSGRLGGRFFYRVSETSLPTGDAYSILPLGYFYHHAPYSLLPQPVVPVSASGTAVGVPASTATADPTSTTTTTEKPSK